MGIIILNSDPEAEAYALHVVHSIHPYMATLMHEL